MLKIYFKENENTTVLFHVKGIKINQSNSVQKSSGLSFLVNLVTVC